MHTLIEHTLYDELSPARRRRAHRRVAEALTSLLGPDPVDRIGELANHWEAADPGERRSDSTTRSWPVSTRCTDLAPQDGVHWFGKALRLLDARPEPDAHRRCTLLVELGVAQRDAGDGTYRDVLLEAAALARELDAPRAPRARRVVQHPRLGELGRDRSTRSASTCSRRRSRPWAPTTRPTGPAPRDARGRDELRDPLASARLALERRKARGRASRRVTTTRSPTCSLVGPTASGFPRRCPNGSRTPPRTSRSPRGPRTRPRGSGPPSTGSPRSPARVTARDRRSSRRRCTRIADDVGLPLLRWEGTTQHAWRALVAGRLEEADRLTFAGLRAGTASDQPDAGVVFAAGVFLLRFDQGRLDEIVEVLEQTVRDTPGIPGLRASLALAYCDLDRDEHARTLLLEECDTRFAGVPYDQFWLVTLVQWALVAGQLARIGGRDDARVPPRAVGRPVRVHRRASVRLGRSRPRRVRSHPGRTVDAAARFADALAAYESFGAPAWAARLRLGWADMLVERDEPGDADHARDLAQGRSSRSGGSLGLGAVERTADRLLGQS